jgi:predicted class III extradiol MEMO1 family dioxygenase
VVQSIENKIENSIKGMLKGTLVLSSDFLHYGTSIAVQKLLERLEDKKVIVRVAHGIYVCPKIGG